MPVRFAVSLLCFDVLLTVWMMHAGIVYCKPSLTNSSHGSVSVSLVLIVGIESLRTLALFLCSHNATQCHYAKKNVSMGQRMVTEWREKEARSHLKATSSVNAATAPAATPSRPVPSRPPDLLQPLKLWSSTLKAERARLFYRGKEIFRKIPNLKGECLCVFSLLWIGCLTRSR